MIVVDLGDNSGSTADRHFDKAGHEAGMWIKKSKNETTGEEEAELR